MGQSCSRNDAQVSLAKELNLPIIPSQQFEDDKVIHTVTTIVSTFWLNAVYKSGKIISDPDLEVCKKNLNNIGELSPLILETNCVKVNMHVIRKPISIFVSEGSPLLKDDDSIYKQLAMQLEKRKSDFKELFSSFEPCAVNNSKSTLRHIDWNCLKDILRQIFGIEPQSLMAEEIVENPVDETDAEPSQCKSHFNEILLILETKHNVFILESIPEYTLLDGLTYSPAVIGKNHVKFHFLFYQLLCIFLAAKKHGFSLRRSLSLEHMYLCYETTWLTLSPFSTLSFVSEPQTPLSGNPLIRIYDGPNTNLSDDSITLNYPLTAYTHAWVEGELCNFDYLVIINKLAGRKFSNCYNHPVFPWVTNFSCMNGGLRDFRKTKFRLNKGDRQLDATYSTTIAFQTPHYLSSSAVQHHISDVLSDVTYYIYHARDTNKETLCKHVRSRWVPNEYPATMERMYHWTPEECIPEFFYDPSIMKSIHNDLEDVGLPDFIKDGSDFVKYHYDFLESDQVSKNLHHWIDVMFGYKLDGVFAKREKNVHLSLVDDHTDLRKFGVAQLFSVPHPEKKVRTTSNMSDGNGGSKEVSLSWEYVDMTHDILEITDGQSVDTMSSFSTEDQLKKFSINTGGEYNFMNMIDQTEKLLCHEASVNSLNESGVGKFGFGLAYTKEITNFATCDNDTKLFVCLVCELLLHKQLQTRTCLPEFNLRLEENYKLLMTSSQIPNFFKSMVKDVVSRKSDGPLILSTVNSCFHWPDSFVCVHGFLCKFFNFIGVVGEDKVSLYATIEGFGSKLSHALEDMPQECVELLVSYLHPLFRDTLYRIPLFLYFFPPLSVALGPTKSKAFFIKDLQKVYESLKTSEDITLLQQSFLSKVMTSFGQECFLELLMDTLINLMTIKEVKMNNKGIEVLKTPQVSRVVKSEPNFKTESFTSYEISPCYFSETDSILSLNLDQMFSEDGNTDSLNRSSDSVSFQPLKRSYDSCDSSQVQVFSSQELSSNGDIDGIIDIDTTQEDLQEFSSTPTNQGDGDVSESVFCDSANGSVDSPFTVMTLMQHEKCTATENLATIYEDTNFTVKDGRSDITSTIVETIQWFIPWLGPCLSMKYIANPLLRRISRITIDVDDEDKTDPINKLLVKVQPIIDCLVEVVLVYGDIVAINAYVPHITKLLEATTKGPTVSVTHCSNLICFVQLMVEVCKVLSPEGIITNEEVLSVDFFQPLIRMLSALKPCSPGSFIKICLSHKLIEIMGLICQKVKRETAQMIMTPLLQQFFSCFDGIYSLDVDQDNKPNVKKKYTNKKKVLSCSTKRNPLTMEEDDFLLSASDVARPRENSTSLLDDILRNDEMYDERYEDIYATFSPALAHHSYILFSRYFSSLYVENTLYNSDLIWHLCMAFDEKLTNGVDEENIQDVQQSIWYQTTTAADETDLLKSRSTWQHIDGNWLQHWSKNLDSGSNNQDFEFVDCKLQTYAGHSSAIRDIYIAENEHYFLSASRDKTVKLWLLKNHGNGTAHLGCSRTYDCHKRAVFTVQGIESRRMIASCDGVVHIWDPITGSSICEYDSGSNHIITSMQTLPAPSVCVALATTGGVMRLYDIRQKGMAQCWKLSPQTNTGMVRSMCANNKWIAAGFSSGIVSVLDLRSGILRGQARVHDTEIVQMTVVPGHGFLASSVDSNIRMWNEDGSVVHVLKSSSEIIHSLVYARQQLLWATASNKLSIHSSEKFPLYTTHRISPDNLKGSLSKMAVLPINHLYLFATDNGNVTLYS